MTKPSIIDLENQITHLQNQVEQQNAFYQLIIDKLPLSVVVFSIKRDTQGQVTDLLFESVNDTFSQLTKTPKVDLINKSLLEIIPETKNYWTKICDNFKNSTFENQYNVVNEAGDRFFKIKFFFSNKNMVVCFISDLTQQAKYEQTLKKQNEEIQEQSEEIQTQNEEFLSLNEELSESYEQLSQANDYLLKKEKELESANKMMQLVLDHIPVRVFWKDLNSNYLGCNRVFLHDAGLSKLDEIIGKTDIELFSRDIGMLYRADDKQVMTTGIPKLNFEEPQAKEGELIRTLRTNKIPISNKQNEIVGVLGTYEDITELKLIQEDLIRAKEKAEESDRLKSAFLANMSHEIRTPMNGIVGFSQLLGIADLSEREKTDYTTIITESSQQLLRIVNDIIDISKIESGMIELHYETLDISHLLHDIVQFYKPLALEKGIELVSNVSINETENIMYCDGTKLRQILDNLVSNALKFTKQGSITLEVCYTNNNLQFKVCDTGTGISKEYHQSIFDRFIQAKDTNKDSLSRGTGLGLSICKGYIEKMNGQIWVNSNGENGSEFGFRIPVDSIK